MSNDSAVPRSEETRRWPPQLRDRLILLAGFFLVLGGFALAGRLNALEAGLAFVALALVALVIPLGSGGMRPLAAEGEETAPPPLPLLRQFADSLADPLLVLSRRAVLLHKNTAAEAQFPTAAIGYPLSFSVRHPALINAIDAAERTGQAQTFELHRTVPEETWHRVTVAPLTLDPTRRPDVADPAVIITLQSISEQRRVEAMRADFVANASHELRTPLTSLIGFIDTLLGPAAKDAAAREKFLGIMRVQAERMSSLIDDLLSLSRIETRQHQRPNAEVDIATLLREVAALLAPQAEAGKVAVRLAGTEAPALVTGDRDELFEVFENIVDNAIKYGADGGSIEVSLGPADRAGFAHLVTVVDHGPGVAAEHVPRLTERFYRVDADISRRKKGTGLGLAIVKHIVSRHRGELSIRSELGRGTRVDILLRR